MPASFHFKAVTPDGKVRTGTITGDNDKTIARELRKQGLMPVYIGLEQKKSFEIALPDFGGSRKKDVLFFTQEMSTLLNSGVPVDRALAIATELTDKPAFRMVVLDVMRVLKGGRTFADSLGTHPKHFGDLYVNMVRAGEASGSLGVVFDRLSEFERTRDELRSYIISSMVYPGLLTAVGIGSIFIL
ncbi:MAG: type II secretion system F family protein, partial [Acidobacteriaceae bacterium]|nr:type II secretion system F family protein [Acidobacteriaceae bacterium]